MILVYVFFMFLFFIFYKQNNLFKIENKNKNYHQATSTTESAAPTTTSAPSDNNEEALRQQQIIKKQDIEISSLKMELKKAKKEAAEVSICYFRSSSLYLYTMIIIINRRRPITLPEKKSNEEVGQHPKRWLKKIKRRLTSLLC